MTTPGDTGLGPVSELHSVIRDAPAAVLVVDLGAGQVVHANDVAQQLAPGLSLPVGLEAWSDAAALRDATGAELSETDHPLTRLLRFEEIPGQRVTARRRSEMGEAREPLWVVGLPMTDAPVLSDHALVVLLSVRERDAVTAVDAVTAAGAFGRHDAEIRDRAVLATGLSFTVADVNDPDMALVWVNPAFTATTGYGFDEAVGRNCRFLQGADTDPDDVAAIRRALAARESVSVTVLNYRKDGLAFYNHVTMTPVYDGDGVVTHYVGVQTDVSGRVESDRQRDAALAAEHEARTRAEQAQDRLELLASASESLTGELDTHEARARLLQLLVPTLADLAIFVHVDDSGTVTEHLTRDSDPELAEVTEHYASLIPTFATPDGLITTLLDGAAFRMFTDIESAASQELQRRLLTSDDYARESVDALQVVSTLTVGLPGRGRTRDVVILNRRAGRAPFTSDDAEVAVDLGRRAGLILDNIRLYATQSNIAQTLQRSLISAMPDLPGAVIEAHYLPGADGAEVGGDFYDLIEVAPRSPDALTEAVQAVRYAAKNIAGKALGAASSMLGATRDDAAPVDHWPAEEREGDRHERRPFAVVVGDVSGHDVYAAAAMGQLKGLVQATATLQDLMPASVLSHVDRLMQALNDEPRTATMVFLHLEPLETGDWLATLSSAGHPPPLLRLPDATLEFVDPDGSRGPLLGLGTPERSEVSQVVPAGSTWFLYTDGLVERRSEHLDVGLDRLRSAVADEPSSEEMTGRVIEQLTSDQPLGDDVVAVAIHLT
ncbi:SpoIIE family protein phosphatase [Nocardioides sp. C4-1]|uniref:SpoIIE family protein phosphatase n=1 Tax=Nocardioides sp. C4-1 TaxID=3151851 RepID=UPI003265F939